MDNIISHDHAQFPNYSKLCTEQQNLSNTNYTASYVARYRRSSENTWLTGLDLKLLSVGS